MLTETKRIALNSKYVTDEITALLLNYPELDADEVLRADMLEGSTHLDEFLSNVLRKIGATQTIIEGTKAYLDEIHERKSRMERREHALRQLIHKVMDTAGLRKRELAEATVSIRNGQAKVVIIEEGLIPDEFMRIKKEPDKTRIKAAIQAHEQVPGCSLSNAEETIAIYVR
jgi:hypothetical protein